MLCYVCMHACMYVYIYIYICIDCIYIYIYNTIGKCWRCDGIIYSDGSLFRWPKFTRNYHPLQMECWEASPIFGQAHIPGSYGRESSPNGQLPLSSSSSFWQKLFPSTSGRPQLQSFPAWEANAQLCPAIVAVHALQQLSMGTESSKWQDSFG